SFGLSRFADGRRATACLGEVEDDAANLRVRLEEREQQRAVAAAYVDDRLVAAPRDALEPLEPALPALSHRTVERRALIRMRAEPRPELLAVHAREGSLAARVEPAHRFEPRAAEEARKAVPAIDGEELRGRCVAEGARLRLLEDAVARER